jgi:hypothetical protein
MHPYILKKYVHKKPTDAQESEAPTTSQVRGNRDQEAIRPRNNYESAPVPVIRDDVAITQAPPKRGMPMGMFCVYVYLYV